MTLIRGFRTELESLVGDGKGKGTSGRTTRLKVPMRQPESHCSIVAKKRSNVRGAKGAGHPRQGGVNGKPEELLVLAEAGRLPWGGTSRMNREIHVRICGRLGVKFPGSTRRRSRWQASASTVPVTEMTAASGVGRSSSEASRKDLSASPTCAAPPSPGGDAAARFPVQAAAGFL